jgi:hypothetical protein
MNNGPGNNTPDAERKSTSTIKSMIDIVLHLVIDLSSYLSISLPQCSDSNITSSMIKSNSFFSQSRRS